MNNNNNINNNNNSNSDNISSFLQALPSSGVLFSKYNIKKTVTKKEIPKYIPAHDTNPPNNEFVKNEDDNILIRSLIKNSVHKRINEQSKEKKKNNESDNEDDSTVPSSFVSEIENSSPNKRTRS
ncbi:hypothetical protein DICPUDRAFT_39893 [Dictyostelium purpureum]|uniref:DET1- and DDB1-associated protein 1 domain-containing protein n=1 Tax=Dictyostelium purpureum TaxID=5786 RepID=F0ZX61_DICPU|nr:uncharacterized protein DICPUDRAFT_39893 [Dictyostelium purpureum]EGC31473.1 hypothetical protein DICPUDRAFT_39893 [Dictyostelium purpureum]|eukprot:XP_003292012.1 hypothetical protein DICPUDRAFT_39893 [Dictyostelium purpureum]